MKPEEIKRILPRASKETIRLNSDSEPSGAIMECGSGLGPLAEKKTQDRDTGVYVVRVTSYRVRLLDEDNLCEKFHVDSCRYAGILHSDAPDKTHIIVTQKKVEKREQQKTLIEITWQESAK